MKKLDSAELWLLKSAVESKMQSLMRIIKDTNSEEIKELYGDYAAMHTKLSIMEIEYRKELFNK